jgi:hypothetical protein
MSWETFNRNIGLLFDEAKRNIDDHIEMLCIQGRSKLLAKNEIKADKSVTQDLIEGYLKKRGYVMNSVGRQRIWTSGFVCVLVSKNHIEVWHDIPNRMSSVFVHESLLTGIPITLNYMERI